MHLVITEQLLYARNRVNTMGKWGHFQSILQEIPRVYYFILPSYLHPYFILSTSIKKNQYYVSTFPTKAQSSEIKERIF